VIGATVIDSDGDEIGEVEDLIVGEDDTIERAVIKVSGSDDDEERFVVVRLNELQRAVGDDCEELTLSRTRLTATTSWASHRSRRKMVVGSRRPSDASSLNWLSLRSKS
jgi:hypothetical protein